MIPFALAKVIQLARIMVAKRFKKLFAVLQHSLFCIMALHGRGKRTVQIGVPTIRRAEGSSATLPLRRIWRTWGAARWISSARSASLHHLCAGELLEAPQLPHSIFTLAPNRTRSAAVSMCFVDIAAA